MKHSFKTSLSHSFNEIIDPLIHSGAHVSLKSPALFWDVGQNMAFRLKVDYRDRSCNIHLGLVAQSCPTLCDPMGCSPAGFSARGILQARILQYTCRLPCPLPGNLHNPGIKPRSPVLQADSLLSETPGKPKNIGVGSHSLLQGIFPTQGSNLGLPHFRHSLSSELPGKPGSILLFPK